MKPNILLVTLVHNRKSLVGKALQSAVNQTLPTDHWKHLVWDNSSTDGAKDVVDIFSNKYDHINSYYCDSNLGQQKAYNEILYKWIPKHAPDVNIIAILDSDDELMPIALDEVYKTYNNHDDIGATYSGFALIDGKGNYITRDHGKTKMAPNQFDPEGQLQLRRWQVGYNICGHLRSYTIDALLDTCGFPTKYQYATDFSIFCNIMEKYKVIKIPKVLYIFRQHGDQIQGKHSPQQTKDWKDLQAYYKERWAKMGLV